MKCVFRINGNDPKMILDSTLYGADMIMFDLYRSVPPECKDEARYLVSESLSFYDFSGFPVFVQINEASSSFCKEDIRLIVPRMPSALILPQASGTSVKEIDRYMETAEKNAGIPAGTVRLIPVLSSADRIPEIREILPECTRISALLVDTEAVSSNGNGSPVLVRSRVAAACAEAGILSMDTLPAEIDPKEVPDWVSLSEELGFDSVVAMDGKQIRLVSTVSSKKEE